MSKAGFILFDGVGRVVAFQSDQDIRVNDAQLYFRETMDQTILQRASRDLSDGTRFIATWVFIASSHKVTYYLGNTTTPVRPPMQANSSPP